MITDEQIQSNLHTDFEREFARQALNSELNSYTEAERDALAPTAPRIILNTTSGNFEGWNGSSWVVLDVAEGASTSDLARLEQNLGLNSLRDAVNGGWAYFNMIDGVSDVFTDETGVDTGAAIDAVYNSAGDYYAPTGGNETLLIQSDTTDGSTTFTDLADSKTITVVGDTQHDTALGASGDPYGGARSSILLDGTADSLTLADHDDWDFGSGEFTVDMWVRPTSISDDYLIGNGLNAGSGWDLNMLNATTIRFIEGSVRTFTVPSISLNTWHHIAIVRIGDDLRLFLDGTESTTGAIALGASYSIPNSSNVLRIGSSQATGGFSINGHLNGIRLIKGSAEFTGNFTVPSAPYTGSLANMTLPSVAFTTQATPTAVRTVVIYDPIDSVTLNTDLILEASRDGGTTWTEFVLESNAVFSGTVEILTSDDIDITSQPVGSTSIKWRARTANAKNIQIHGVYLQWRS